MEEILWEGRQSWWRYWFVIFMGSLLTLWGIMLGIMVGIDVGKWSIYCGIFLIIVMCLSRMRYKFTVTTLKIASRFGLISRYITELGIEDIRSINLRQSIFQRILNVGSLEFTTAAGPLKDSTFIWIPDPLQIKALVSKIKLLNKNLERL